MFVAGFALPTWAAGDGGDPVHGAGDRTDVADDQADVADDGTDVGDEPETDDDSDVDGPIGAVGGTHAGIGASVRMPGVAFATGRLHVHDVSIVVEGGAARHELFGFDANSTLLLGLARYRSPIAWHGWAPTVDGGLVWARSEAAGVTVKARGWTGSLGVERFMNESKTFLMRAEARAIRLLDETHWLAGVGLEYRFALPGGTSGARRGAGGGAGIGGRRAATVASVQAEGRITGTSLPISVSGTWSYSADPTRRDAAFEADGVADGERGGIGFGSPRRVSPDGTSATFRIYDEHEGMEAWADVEVSVSESGMGLDVTAYRADGLSMGASLSGSTDTFEVVPLPEPEPEESADDGSDEG